MKKILVTGGTGRFATILKKNKLTNKIKYKFIYLNKKNFNILNYNKILYKLKKLKPFAILHLAGLSRPLKIHDNKIHKSIDANIIGTANVVKACAKLKVKLIYFSTSYVYPGTKGNYKESDPVLPWSNYGWSKLGGESAVQMYNNSLILRVCMTEKPFLHPKAYTNVKSNFIFHEDLIPLLLKVLNKKGLYNLGGNTDTIYNFARKSNKNIKKIKSRGNFPLNQDMNLNKLKKIL